MSIRKLRTTIAPVGADGVATAASIISRGTREGFLRAVAIDYQNQPATCDVVIKADDEDGQTLFTRTSSNTDLPGTPVVSEGLDAAGAASTSQLPQPYTSGLHVEVAQGDAGATKLVVVDVWVEE